MAGFVQDELVLSLSEDNINQKSHTKIEVAQDLNEKALEQASKLVAVGNKIRELSPGLTTNFGSQEIIHTNDGELKFSIGFTQTENLDQSSIHEVLLNDYSKQNKIPANLKLKGTGGNPALNNQPAIDINPENIDKIITALEKAAKDGQDLKQSLITHNESTNLNKDEYAKIEVTFRHGLSDELKNITNKTTVCAAK